MRPAHLAAAVAALGLLDRFAFAQLILMPLCPQSPQFLRAALVRVAQVASASPATHFATGVFVLLLDLLTGPFLMFPVFFVVPVITAAWFCGRWSSMILAVLLPIGRASIAAYYELPKPLPFVLANAASRIAVLLLISYLVSRTARQTRGLAHRVKVLEGLLPICMFCKRIRDEQENWRQLESYIAQHSEASFSHGVCPECMREHYRHIHDDQGKA